ncbi:MAG: glycosyltransferase family 2 protein [Candidatus Acidiferrales bacterium]
MHYFWTGLLGLVALTWVITSVRAVRGMSSLPRLSQVTPAPDDDCPTVSILVAARDEAEKLPAALATLLAQNYPRYEVIAVNDRSNDPTGQILDEFARTHKNLKVIHLTELPPGWLGKPHALTTAFKQATGDWLVFTDADVHFAPDVLRRTVALVQERHWDHLTAMAFIELKGFWEKTVVTFFALGFILSLEPWQVSNPRSRHYMGMGAFQLLRRSTYEAVGTHRRLAMEVVDDVKLGKLVKRAGFRSGVALSEERIRLRWQDGVGNIIRGLTKNSFAFHGYNPGVTLFLVVAVLALHVLPLVAVVFTSGLTRALAVVGTLTVMLFHAHTAYHSRVSPLYGLTNPLGAVLTGYIMLRSMVVTLWRGGVVWRDTFYPLEDLRKGMV